MKKSTSGGSKGMPAPKPNQITNNGGEYKKGGTVVSHPIPTKNIVK